VRARGRRLCPCLVFPHGNDESWNTLHVTAPASPRMSRVSSIVSRTIRCAVVARSFGTFAGQPLVDWWGLVVMAVVHATLVEFVYYWVHRALHIGWMFKRWHAYHHASINTEPTTSFSFEPGERIIYTVLFSLAPFTTYYLGYGSWLSLFVYLIWFDITNGFGHINFEMMPKWFASSPLWYFGYTPSYHSIHHTRFKKNFSLFMVWPDVLFGTADLNLTLNVFNGALDQAAPIVEEPVPPEVVPLV